MQANERNARNPFCFLCWFASKKIWQHLHVQPQLPSCADNPQSFFPIVGSSQDHLVNEASPRKFCQVAGTSHHALSWQLPIIQQPANRSAQLRMLLQMIRQSLAYSTCSNDEHIPHATGGASAMLDTFSFGPTRCHQSARVQNAGDPPKRCLYPTLAASPPGRGSARDTLSSQRWGWSFAGRWECRILRDFSLRLSPAVGEGFSRDQPLRPLGPLALRLARMQKRRRHFRSMPVRILGSQSPASAGSIRLRSAAFLSRVALIRLPIRAGSRPGCARAALRGRTHARRRALFLAAAIADLQSASAALP